MKLRSKALICCVLIAACLMGCGSTEDPYRVDTVVRIPVEPTEVSETETVAAETAVPTETAAETEATEAPKSSGGKSSSGKSSGGKSSGGKTSSGNKGSSGSSAKATEPPVTEAPATEPPVTEPPATQPPYDPSSYSIGSLEYAILDQLNAYRAEAGLSALSMSGKLCGIAGLRAEEVSRVWSHTRPDGRNYTTAMSDYGYGYGASAENLAYAVGSGDASAIVAEWMEAGNRDSILSSSFTTAGVGIYRTGGVTYIANILVG